MNITRTSLAVVGLSVLLTLVHAHESTHAAYEASLDAADKLRLAAAASLRDAPANPDSPGQCRVTLRLLDAVTKRPVAGIVRIRRDDGSTVPLPGALNRGVGLRGQHPAKHWYAVVENAETVLPAERLRMEAIAGLDTELTTETIDLRGRKTADLTLLVRRFDALAGEPWRSGNTHLHLAGISRKQADEYLQTVPRVDGLDLLFVSYLSRAGEDAAYVSNSYTAEQLHAFAGGGLHYGWGEEHRHNFPGEDGYGHVMLLELPRLIHPVSIGRTLMREGPDYPPLRTGIDAARRDGATIIWCHNANGSEDLPSLFTGRIDAVNIFDSGPAGDYSVSYYRYLNIGLSVPFSAGTDWFIHSFSRVYARVPGPLTRETWLAALRAGRTFITNGTLLELRAGDRQIGDTIALDAPREVMFEGRATGRNDFLGVDLIHNGAIVAHADSRPEAGHFVADLRFKMNVAEPGWVALRVAGGGVDTNGGVVLPPGVPIYRSGKGYNEMGSPLFGHTSPIYLEFSGRRVFVPEVAHALIRDLQHSKLRINELAHFDSVSQRDEVMQIYDEAIGWLRQRLAESATRD